MGERECFTAKAVQPRPHTPSQLIDETEAISTASLRNTRTWLCKSTISPLYPFHFVGILKRDVYSKSSTDDGRLQPLYAAICALAWEVAIQESGYLSYDQAATLGSLSIVPRHGAPGSNT
jgi:hypothetical protein